MPRLSNDERNQAVTMLLRGSTQQEVATAFGVHQTTVQRLQSRLHLFGNTNDRPRSGRPRVTTVRQDRHIRLTHLRNRMQTVVQTAATTAGIHNQRISDQTVRNRLRESGIRAYRPLVGNPLTDRRRRARMDVMIPVYGEDNVGSRFYSLMSHVFPSTEQMVVSVYTEGETNVMQMLASLKEIVLVAEVLWFGVQLPVTASDFG